MKTMTYGAAALLTLALPVEAAELTISGSGGALAEVMKQMFNDPFQAETGITVHHLATTDRASAIRAMVLAGNTVWDATELNAMEYATASVNGWLEPLDWDRIDPEGMLPENARLPDAAMAATYSNILAIRSDKLPEGKEMTSWADFWDVETFPGPRALQNQPFDNLEFALLADGVAKEDLYTVLATEEGVDRAFDKLDEIKPEVVNWWTSGAQAVQMLFDGEVYFTSAFNDRIVKAQLAGEPIRAVWNGAAAKPSYMAIPKGAANVEAAEDYMRFLLTDPARAAAFATAVPYPFFTKDMYAHLDEAAGRQLPTHPDNLAVQFVSDGLFWGEHYDEINERWQDWVAE
ncbi:ABC transporter substrate-binding protein [uncultured Paracoccus sp.]|uniref:ABC transporter substrate-binding protein n=1 Tax=uncultured Paracoccus sp. TaxID=189685 RepID=UPI002620A939|nr:ABC transporter substrate-binding protein [uncultured Paracoccus sp.]